MKSEKVAKEVAEQEFQRMCDFARVDADESEMDDESKEKFRDLKADLVKLIQKGSLIVTTDGSPTYAGLTFKSPTGAAVMAFETYGPNKNMSNLAAVMCELTGSEKSTFGKLHAKDFNVCSQIVTLFLG